MGKTYWECSSGEGEDLWDGLYIAWHKGIRPVLIYAVEDNRHSNLMTSTLP